MKLHKKISATPQKIWFHVVLKDNYTLPYTMNAHLNTTDNQFNIIWEALKSLYKDIALQPVFTGLTIIQLKNIVQAAVANDPTYTPVNLLQYYFISATTNAPKQFMTHLSKSGLFELVAPEVDISLPSDFTPEDEPNYDRLGYLRAAPEGINAMAAWNTDGGKGDGIRFIDIEQGWYLNHDDLEMDDHIILDGENRVEMEHGTSVLSIICAKDNIKGGIGIAPNCTVNTISIIKSIPEAPINNLPNAIAVAALTLKKGDVLLIEIENGTSPIETHPVVFNCIRTLTAIGIIIIEPAANGGRNLDTYPGLDLNRTSPGFKDSYAIMVGGAQSTSRARIGGNSNFGTRIDCFAWYDNVYAAVSLPNNYAAFGGTSAAAAIIAGATIALQGIIFRKFGIKFDALQMRRLLSEPAMCTPSNNPLTDCIAGMPDLGKIITGLDRSFADIYVRDNISDNGTASTGAISISPDIITVSSAVLNPQERWGAGSGTENSNDLGSSVRAGSDNYIYVRVSNRGSMAATNITVKVYYSEVASLVSPDAWIYIGATTIPTVPPGDSLTVTQNPIAWDSSTIPHEGHYCYICSIQCDEDTTFEFEEIAALDWSQFIQFIRVNNNITWKNFNVIDSPPAAHSPYILPFLLRSAFDSARMFDINIIENLPKGTVINLIFPNKLKPILLERDIEIKHRNKMLYIELDRKKMTQLNNLKLPKKLNASCYFELHFPKRKRLSGNEYYLTLQQRFENTVIGAVSWKLALK
ncbi:MAG: hypothetical protein U0T77_11495 [Chitinophagales bacterium]